MPTIAAGAHRSRLRACFCSRATNDSMAALTPTQPVAPAPGSKALGRRFARTSGWPPRCRISRINRNDLARASVTSAACAKTAEPHAEAPRDGDHFDGLNAISPAALRRAALPWADINAWGAARKEARQTFHRRRTGGPGDGPGGLPASPARTASEAPACWVVGQAESPRSAALRSRVLE